MPSNNFKQIDIISSSKPPVKNLLALFAVSAVLLFVSYIIYTSGTGLAGGNAGGGGLGHFRSAPVEGHGLLGVFLGITLSIVFAILFQLIFSLIPPAVQSLLFLALGLFAAFHLINGVIARTRMPIGRIEIGANGITSFGLFGRAHLNWDKIVRVKAIDGGALIEYAAWDGSTQSLNIANIDASPAQILAVIWKYRPDLPRVRSE